MLKRSLLALAAAALAACGSAGDGALAGDAISASAVDPGNAGGNKLVTVMTRNLYVGGDLFLPFVSPDPLLAASTVWGDILASDPAARMAAIADELRIARPDLVGLEEAYRFIVTPLGATSPVLLDLDYLALLEGALSGPDDPPLRRIAEQTHTVITIPFPAQGIQITLIDRDAILADDDVNVRSVGGGNFDAEFPTTLAGVIPVHLLRGWVEAEVKHQGVDFTFVAVHLETKDFGPLQSLQASELLQRFGGTAPTIVVGDMNSDPGDPAYVLPGSRRRSCRRPTRSSRARSTTPRAGSGSPAATTRTSRRPRASSSSGWTSSSTAARSRRSPRTGWGRRRSRPSADAGRATTPGSSRRCGSRTRASSS